jgi:hypothetical protein
MLPDGCGWSFGTPQLWQSIWVPMQLPSTTLPVAPAPAITTPAPALPDMMFLEPAVVPPTVLPVPLIAMPAMFGTAKTPVTSVPIRFPRAKLRLLAMRSPDAAFPEIRLAAFVDVPPIVLPFAPASSEIPFRALATAVVPAALVPMRLFVKVLPVLVPRTWMPLPPQPLMVRPEIVLPGVTREKQSSASGAGEGSVVE